MASTAIDIEQSNLSQRVVGPQVSADFEDEKGGFADGLSSNEEKPSSVWQPQDA